MSATETTTDFQPGDTVILNSGSPMMTVVDVGKRTGVVFCRMMRPSGKLSEQAISPELLRNCEEYGEAWLRP